MGFISFNEKYYSLSLGRLENKTLTNEEIYEVKQLLKVLDDLTDEGYTNLNNQMEKDFSCITRLRDLIANANELPFTIDHERLPQTTYQEEEVELESLLELLISEAKKYNRTTSNTFLKNIHDYCEWIGKEDDTAYVFLLRDTLLPYIYYRNMGCNNIYPWLINRKFLEDITEIEYVDDDIRLPIYEALESGHIVFSDFSSYCKAEILSVLDKHSELKRTLKTLLTSIKEKNIVVIESGYGGTFPMMLSALDDRVTFKMYTTAPFLYKTYDEHVFCKKYEDIRRFETLYSQDLLFQYSSYRDGKFYVRLSEEYEVKSKSLAEIRFFID